MERETVRSIGPQGRKPIKSVKITSDLVWICKGKLEKKIHVPTRRMLEMAAIELIEDGLDAGIFSKEEKPYPLPPGVDKKLLKFMMSLGMDNLKTQSNKELKAACDIWYANRSQWRKATEIVNEKNVFKALRLLERMNEMEELFFEFDILTLEEAIKAFNMNMFLAQRYNVMCRGKKVYETVELAENGRQQYEAIHDEAMQSYRCPICQGLHIGHMSEKRFGISVAERTPGVGVKNQYGNPGNRVPLENTKKEISEEWEKWFATA